MPIIVDISRAGRMPEATGGPIRAGDGRPTFGADMRTDTIESPEADNIPGMTSITGRMTETMVTGVLTGTTVHETPTMDMDIAARAV